MTKTVLTLFVLALTAPTYAQTSLKTFTSPDGLFRLHYRHLAQTCPDPQKNADFPNSNDAENSPPAAVACRNQGCDGPGSGGSVLACFSYPRERFRDKPSFGGASLYVTAIEARNQKACLSGSPNWFVISKKPRTTTIHHVTFKTFETGDNWAGAGESGPAYRTFHEGRCYEVGFQMILIRAYDPGTIEEFTRKDAAEVKSELEQVLHSFVFLK